MSQGGLVGQAVEDIAGQLLCASFEDSIGRDGVLSIRSGRDEEDDAYNLEKMSFQ